MAKTPEEKQDEAYEALERTIGMDWGTKDECAVVLAKISPDGKVEILHRETGDGAIMRILRRLKFW